MGIIGGWSGGSAAELVASMHVDEEPAVMAVRVAREGTARLERAEQAAELERAAEQQDRHEAMLLRYAQLGLGPHSLADVFDSASRAGDEDAELADAQQTIARIERRRAARRETARLEGEQVAAVQRADSTDLLGPAKQAHRAYVEASRAAWSAATSGAPRARRPKGSGGHAVRSENCIHCVSQGATDEESFLLHSDPQLGLPVTPPKSAEQAMTAERRTPRRDDYGVISR